MSESDAFEAGLSALSVATADAAGPAVPDDIVQLLALIRDHLGMDVAFVSEFVDGKRVVRHGSAGDVPGALRDALARRGGFSTPLEQTLCQRMMDGRLPRGDRTFHVV